MKLKHIKYWSYYFRDTTHTTFGIFNLFFRLLPNNRKQSINREYYAQRFLAPTSLVPKPYFKLISPVWFLPSIVVEERVNFHKKYQKSKQFIVDVGKSLKIFHEFSRSQKKVINKYIPEDIFLQNGTYDPSVILQNFIEGPFIKIAQLKPKLATRVVRKSILEIGRKIRILAKNTKYKPEYCSLVHGDLNDTNVVRNIGKNGVTYLDWADSRWDIASCDISQFIYLHKLTKQEKSWFLDSYGAEWVTKSIIEIHHLLLIGWDLIYLMTIDLQIPPDKIDRLLPLKRSVWEEKKLAI